MKVLIGFLLFLSTGCFLSSYAQTRQLTIQGDVSTENHLIAEAATVLLISTATSKTVRSAITDKNGHYEIDKVNLGKYAIVISKVGYEKYVSLPFDIADDFTLPAVTLKAIRNELKDVTITADRGGVQIKPDRIIMNIDQNAFNAGHSAFEILSSAPGVKISNSDEILFKGGQRALITINGKTTNLTGQDLSTLLMNMQSGEIEQIELINNPSAKYDASGAGGVINIILKKQKNIGANGILNATVGYGAFYKSSTGINWNYRSRKINLFGNIGIIGNKSERQFNINRNVYYQNIVTKFDVGYHSVQTGPSTTYRAGADFFADSLHTIGFVINGYYNYNQFGKDNLTLIGNGARTDSSITTIADLDRTIGFANYNLNYSGKINNHGATLSLDLDLSNYKRRSFEDISSTLTEIVPVNNYLPATYTNNSPGRIRNKSAKVDFVSPLTTGVRLEAGLKYSHVNVDNTQDFERIINNKSQNIITLTDHFWYNENLSMGYINYVKSDKKFSYTLGLRVEHTNSRAESQKAPQPTLRNYTNVFPTLQFNYKQSAAHQFTLMLTSRFDRPTYEDLNPFIGFQDRYNFAAGNFYLKPAYQTGVQLTHTLQGRYVTGLYASLVTDAYNFSYFAQNDTTKISVATKTNLGRVYSYGLTFNAPVQFSNKWNANFDIDAAYLRYTTYQAYGHMDKYTADIILKTTQSFKLPLNLTADVFGMYETPTFWGIVKLKSLYYANAGIGRSLFNNAGTIRFNVDDIFNTRSSRYSTNFKNLDLTGVDKRETRIFRLNFTYRFGKSTVKAARKRTSGNDEEQKRIGN